MLPMVRALRGRGDEGNPLPSVYVALDKLGAKFRRGQLSLILAAPGGGKSAFVTNLAVKAGVGTEYLSADTDSSTMAKRIVASLRGWREERVSRDFDDKTEELENHYRILMEKTGHISWDFDRAPDVRSIEDTLDAYQMLHGQHPELICVDNLKDVWGEGDSDGQDHVRYDRVIDFLRQLADQTKAHIAVLHHVTGPYENGDEPIPLGGALGKISKNFRLCLSIHNTGDDYMRISVVKNTSGKADPTGQNVIAAVPWDKTTMTLADWYDPADPRPWREVAMARGIN